MWSVPQTVHGLYFGYTTTLSGDRQAPALSPRVTTTPQIAATQAGDVYVVWAEDNDKKDRNTTVQFTASADNGMTFMYPRVLSNDQNSAHLPQIAAIESGSVYVVWVDTNSTSGDSDIVFRASTDSGKNFGRTKTLSRDIEGSASSLLLSSSPQIAATENGRVYLVWVDTNSTSGDSDIVFRGSTTSGENFSRRVLSRDIQGSPPLLSSSPQIAATENGSVYIVRVDTNSTSGDSDIVLRASTDSGKKFNSKKLSREIERSTVSPQLVAIQNGNAYVLWVESNPQFSEVLDNGTIAGEILSLGQTTNTASYPRITATENGNLYMIWIDRKNNTAEGETVHFKKSSQFFFNRNR
jgi:hypothetical protein